MSPSTNAPAPTAATRCAAAATSDHDPKRTPCPPITLPDGRDLELEVNGPDDGPVIVSHHGTPGASTPAAGARPGGGGARVSLRHLLAGRVRRVDPAPGPQRGRRGRRHGCGARPPRRRHLPDAWAGPAAARTPWPAAPLLPDRVRGVLVIAGVAPYDAEGLDFLAGMGPENVEEFGAAARRRGDLARPRSRPSDPSSSTITGRADRGRARRTGPAGRRGVADR